MSESGDGASHTDTQTYSVTFPANYVDTHLSELYPAATSDSEAIRMGIQDLVKSQSQHIRSAQVSDTLVDSLMRSGGRLENIQRVHVGDVDVDHQSTQVFEGDEE